MKKYQTSIIQEKKELDRRIKKLNKLMASQIYKDMHSDERLLRVDQKKAMVNYTTILGVIIRNFA